MGARLAGHHLPRRAVADRDARPADVLGTLAVPPPQEQPWRRGVSPGYRPVPWRSKRRLNEGERHDGSDKSHPARRWTARGRHARAGSRVRRDQPLGYGRQDRTERCWIGGQSRRRRQRPVLRQPEPLRDDEQHGRERRRFGVEARCRKPLTQSKTAQTGHTRPGGRPDPALSRRQNTRPALREFGVPVHPSPPSEGLTRGGSVRSLPEAATIFGAILPDPLRGRLRTRAWNGVFLPRHDAVSCGHAIGLGVLISS